MKYLKMIIPKFGKFSNGYYDIVGIMWLGRLIGKCTYSAYKYVMEVGDWKDLPQYHLKKDRIPQFYRVSLKQHK